MASEFKSKASNVFAWIGVFATLSGAVAGISSLWLYWENSSKNAIIDTAWVKTSEIVTITPESIDEYYELVVDGIRVEPGEYRIKKPIRWIANRVLLDQNAVLIVEDATIISKEVAGGYIKADGSKGPLHGGDAGSIKIAFLTQMTATLSATGENGASGSRGAKGPDGRNGRCDGFGKWRSAHRGKNGSRGGPGGNGGNGGVIVVIGPSNEANYIPDFNVQGGLQGAGGKGGVGGRGGRGCTGLGGSQSSESAGSPGEDGSSGQAGQNGRYQRILIEASQLAETIRPTIENDRVDDIWKSLVQ